MRTPLICRLIEIRNSLDLAAKRAAIAASHAMVIFNAPAAMLMLSADLAPIAAVAVPYANRVPPTVESHMLNPNTLAGAAVAVANVMTTVLLIDPAGDAAAPILTDTRVLNGPSDAPSSVGAPVANESQRCAGCVTAAPPKHQSSKAFSKYEVSGIRQW